MAIFNPILGHLSGRVAGIVFSHNKGGPYVRSGTTPTNPNTSRQQITRSILASYSTFWLSNLDQASRDAWDVWAATHPVKNAFGEDVYITGLCWYVKCCARLSDAALSAPSLPPTEGAPDGYNALACDISATSTVDVTFAPALGATEAMQLWASLPVTLGSTPNLKQCRLVGYSGLAEASPWAATLPHSCQTGQRMVFYACVLGEEGLISAFRQSIDDADF